MNTFPTTEAAWSAALTQLGEFALRQGPGVLGQAPALLGELGLSRALLVCGEQVRRLPAVVELLGQASGRPVGVFDRVEPDPSDATVAAGAGLAREVRADCLLAIGGGSSLDAAKAIAAEAVAPGWIGACAETTTLSVPADPLPVLAVPTTAGTGSEVTAFCVITFGETHLKRALTDPAFRPRGAILDPSLLTSAPHLVRVAAGLDALTHAMESYVSLWATEDTRPLAAAAAGLVACHLPAAASAGDPSAAPLDDLAALQRAAFLAGVAFSQTRLGLVHALALPLSARFGVPHGLANAILLPHGMAFNLTAAPAAYANLAAVMDVYAQEGSGEVGADSAVECVDRLANLVGAPRRMREVGVTHEAITQMAQDALGSVHLTVNPRPVTLSDLVGIYEGAW